MSRPRYTTVIICAIVAVALMLSGCRRDKETQSSSDVSGITQTIQNGGFDPENTEWNSENGAVVDAEDLYHQSGRANGIDVSKWQGKIDWNAVGKSGIDFAIIRIGFRGENGQIYKDQYADYNLQQAEKYGVLTGVYFFSTAVTVQEAAEEADWTAAAIAGYPISYPVVYDCEGFLLADSRMAGVGAGLRTDIALAFAEKIRSAGYEPMVYAAKSELERADCWETSRLEAGCMIWVARYTDPPYPQTASPDYAGRYDMWQYTNMGRVAGISGNADLVLSYFTREKAAPRNAAQRPGNASAPDPDDQIYTAVNEQVTAKELVNLRDAATTRGAVVAQLKNGEFLTRTGVGTNGWSRLNYNGQTVYAITSYLTTDLNYQPPVSQETADVVNGNTFTAVQDRVTAKEETNLRTAPSTTESSVVYTLKNGEFLTRVAVSDKGWSRLIYNGQTVYAVTNYLTTEANPPVNSEPEQGSGMVFREVNEQVTAKDETNLRTAPSTSESSIVYTLKNGEYMTRTGVSNSGWSRLSYNGQTVYAITSYLMTAE